MKSFELLNLFQRLGVVSSGHCRPYHKGLFFPVYRTAAMSKWEINPRFTLASLHAHAQDF
jgi:hypothetical protein